MTAQPGERTVSWLDEDDPNRGAKPFVPVESVIDLTQAADEPPPGKKSRRDKPPKPPKPPRGKKLWRRQKATQEKPPRENPPRDVTPRTEDWPAPAGEDWLTTLREPDAGGAEFGPGPDLAPRAPDPAVPLAARGPAVREAAGREPAGREPDFVRRLPDAAVPPAAREPAGREAGPPTAPSVGVAAGSDRGEPPAEAPRRTGPHPSWAAAPEGMLDDDGWTTTPPLPSPPSPPAAPSVSPPSPPSPSSPPSSPDAGGSARQERVARQDWFTPRDTPAGGEAPDWDGAGTTDGVDASVRAGWDGAAADTRERPDWVTGPEPAVRPEWVTTPEEPERRGGWDDRAAQDDRWGDSPSQRDGWDGEPGPREGWDREPGPREGWEDRPARGDVDGPPSQGDLRGGWDDPPARDQRRDGPALGQGRDGPAWDERRDQPTREQRRGGWDEPPAEVRERRLGWGGDEKKARPDWVTSPLPAAPAAAPEEGWSELEPRDAPTPEAWPAPLDITPDDDLDEPPAKRRRGARAGGPPTDARAGRPTSGRGPRRRRKPLMVLAIALTAVVAAAAVVAAGTIYRLVFEPGTPGSHTIAAPLDGRTDGELELATGARTVTVSGADLGDALFQVSTPESGDAIPLATIRGERTTVTLASNRGEEASAVEIRLNTRVTWRLLFTAGAVTQTVDFRGGKLSGLEMAGGATRLELTLPKPGGTVPIRLRGGLDELLLHAPQGVPTRVKVTKGATNVTLDRLNRSKVAADTTFTPNGWAQAKARYDVNAAEGIGTVKLDRR